jgi:hypothetical protein
VLEYLPSIFKALDSIHRTKKNREQKRSERLKSNTIDLLLLVTCPSSPQLHGLQYPCTLYSDAPQKGNQHSKYSYILEEQQCRENRPF